MKKHPDGIDPENIFMNGTLNVVTGFALGIIYKFTDSDFVKFRVRNFIHLLMDGLSIRNPSRMDF